jgi:urease accessory protein
MPATQDGQLRVAMKLAESGKTVVESRIQRFPLRTTVPMYVDPHDPGFAFLYEQNPSGAVFSGDDLTTELVAGPGTRVHLTTQSATKLHKMDGGRGRHRFSFAIADGAYLEYLPDLLIPQAGSSLRQVTTVRVEPGGSYLGAETISPGRAQHGELFEYRELDLETRIESAGELLACDRMRLRGDRRGSALGRKPYLSTIIFAEPGAEGDSTAAAIEAELGDAGLRDTSAAGAMPNGAGTIVRALSASADEARAVVDTVWATVRRRRLGLPLPLARK